MKTPPPEPKPKPKPARGGPLLPIDPRQVETLASIGCTTVEIAAVVGCSVDTINGRFGEIIEKGRESGKVRLRKKQLEVALNGNVTMLIWLGKQILGQTEKVEAKTHHTGTVTGTLDPETEAAVKEWALDIRKRIKPANG